MAEESNQERPQGRSCHSNALHWDERYRRPRDEEAPPDPFLDSVWDALPAHGLALDLACGAGRHALALARRFEVEAVDFSKEALGLTQQRAAAHGLSITTRRMDLEAPGADLGQDRYDLITAFYYLHRPLLPKIARAVKPGKFVVYKTYTTEHLRFSQGPRNPDFLLKPAELPAFFPGWRVIRYEEECEGRGTAALLAQKPSSPDSPAV